MSFADSLFPFFHSLTNFSFADRIQVQVRFYDVYKQEYFKMDFLRGGSKLGTSRNN